MKRSLYLLLFLLLYVPQRGCRPVYPIRPKCETVGCPGPVTPP